MHAVCGQCKTKQPLSLNPRIIGTILDESGAMAAAKLVWSEEAWNELLFGKTGSVGIIEFDDDDGTAPSREHPSWRLITTLDDGTLRGVEDRLLHSRVTLTFGWSQSLERLCVLGVDW